MGQSSEETTTNTTNVCRSRRFLLKGSYRGSILKSSFNERKYYDNDDEGTLVSYWTYQKTRIKDCYNRHRRNSDSLVRYYSSSPSRKVNKDVLKIISLTDDKIASENDNCCCCCCCYNVEMNDESIFIDKIQDGDETEMSTTCSANTSIDDEIMSFARSDYDNEDHSLRILQTDEGEKDSSLFYDENSFCSGFDKLRNNKHSSNSSSIREINNKNGNNCDHIKKLVRICTLQLSQEEKDVILASVDIDSSRHFIDDCHYVSLVLNKIFTRYLKATMNNDKEYDICKAIQNCRDTIQFRQMYNVDWMRHCLQNKNNIVNIEQQKIVNDIQSVWIDSDCILLQYYYHDKNYVNDDVGGCINSSSSSKRIMSRRTATNMVVTVPLFPSKLNDTFSSSIYTLETVTSFTDDNKITITFDFRGRNPWNWNFMKFAHSLITLLKIHYPERLKQLYLLDAPILVRILWMIASHLVGVYKNHPMPFVYNNTKNQDTNTSFDDDGKTISVSSFDLEETEHSSNTSHESGTDLSSDEDEKSRHNKIRNMTVPVFHTERCEL